MIKILINSMPSGNQNSSSWTSVLLLCPNMAWELSGVSFIRLLISFMGRNGMDLTEAEEIKKRWQEYAELYKNDLHDPDNHNGVITQLEPDILKSEVKWALGIIMMNKPSGGDGIPAELFQVLKDDAVKVLHSTC